MGSKLAQPDLLILLQSPEARRPYDVAVRIEAEGLRQYRAALGAGYPHQIVVGVVAGLAVGGSSAHVCFRDDAKASP